MAGIPLDQRLANLVRSLIEEGILDHYFLHLETVRNEGNNPLFILESIYSYIRDSKESQTVIAQCMTENVVNYAQVKDAAMQLRFCSLRIGGCRVVQACRRLEEECYEDNRDRCLESFRRVNEEFGTLYENLGRIIKIETARLDQARRRGNQP